MMGFWQHLDELKARLVRCLMGFFVGFGICYTWTNEYVFKFLQQPLFNALPPEQQNDLLFTGEALKKLVTL